MEEHILTIWTFVLLLFGWSYLIKVTALFHFIEYTLIGLGAAHAFNVGFWFLIDRGITPIMEGQFILIVGFILGASTYLRFWRKYAWIMRYSLGLMAGTYIGLALRGIIQASIIKQIIGTLTPIVGMTGAEAVNQIILIFVLVCTVWYFIYTKRLSFSPGPYKYVSLFGRIFVIVVLGFYLSMDMVSSQQYMLLRVEFILTRVGEAVNALVGG